MKRTAYFSLLPLAFSACARNDPPSAVALSESNPAEQAAFDQAYATFTDAKRNLAARACAETACPVPAYPASQALLATLRATYEQAETLLELPASAELSASRREEALRFSSAMRKHADQLEEAVRAAESGLESVRPSLEQYRRRLADLGERARQAGCEIPEDGSELRCPRMASEIRSLEDAAAQVKKNELSEELVELSLLIGQQYASIPSVENTERTLARRRAGEGKSLSLTTLGGSSVSRRVRDFVDDQWRAAVRDFREDGIQAAPAPDLNEALNDENDDELLNQARAAGAAAQAFANALRTLDHGFLHRAVDRVEIVAGPTKIYPPEAFAFHPSHPSSLRVQINQNATASDLRELMLKLPTKLGEAYQQRQALVARWNRVSAEPLPSENEPGRSPAVIVRVERNFLQDLPKRMPLKDALGTLDTLRNARDAFTRELGYAQQRRQAWAEAPSFGRLLICDLASCPAEPAAPGEVRIKLGPAEPALNRNRLYKAARELLGS